MHRKHRIRMKHKGKHSQARRVPTLSPVWDLVALLRDSTTMSLISINEATIRRIARSKRRVKGFGNEVLVLRIWTSRVEEACCSIFSRSVVS